MANKSGKDTVVLLGNALKGYDVTGWFNKIALSGEVDATDATVFGQQSENFITGLQKSKLSAEGIFEFTPGTPPTGIDPIVVQSPGGLLGTSEGAEGNVTIIVLPGGGAFGDRANAVNGILTAYEVESPHDGITTIKLEEQGDDTLDLGKILFPLASLGGGGITSSVSDDGAAAPAATASVAFFYACTVHTAGTTTYKLQDSADNVSFADVPGTTFAFTVTSAGRVEVAVPLRRYVRANCVAGSVTATVLCGYSRKFI